MNNTLDEDTSIHWHGILLPFQMDGVPGISFTQFFLALAPVAVLGLGVIWGTGKAQYDEFAALESERVRVRPYLAPIAHAYFALMLRAAANHGPVLREIVHRTRGNPETVAHSEAWAAFRQGVHEPFRRLLAERMDEIGHDDPPFALRFAFSAVSSALRESVLFGHMEPSMGPVEADVMARELARLFCRYLDVPFPAGADAGD